MISVATISRTRKAQNNIRKATAAILGHWRPVPRIVRRSHFCKCYAHWAGTKRKWLATFLDLSAGIPSHDRFNAILGALKPAEFEKCLLSWITALHELTDGQLVAIDGKTLRRSFDAANSKSAIHMVSAWATANHITLGQVVVDAEIERDHGHSKTTGNSVPFRLFGDDRCHGLPDRDRRGYRRQRRGLRTGREAQPAHVVRRHPKVLRMRNWRSSYFCTC